RGATGGRPWVKLDLTQFQAQGLSSGRDVLANLSLLSAVGTQVEDVGHDVVHGVKTTHYRAQLDLQKVVEHLPPAFAAAKGGLDQLRGQSLPPMSMDVWLDGAGLPRRLVVGLSIEGTSFEGTTEITDTDTPVHVTAPPDDQTVAGSTIQQVMILVGATAR